MAAPARTEILALYRRILFSAARFPSKNRDRVYAEIRDEFRRNAPLAPGSDRALEEVALAERSLKQLEQYSSMTRSAGNWEVTLDSNPMPRRPDAAPTLVEKGMAEGAAPPQNALQGKRYGGPNETVD
mmetsp:Transcript_16356/g.48815  ORF Transcript_16356/g.48815 Transcript_16356/m.48815 type:complete len:128 (-) Transcript_16356:24-407(-)